MYEFNRQTMKAMRSLLLVSSLNATTVSAPFFFSFFHLLAHFPTDAIERRDEFKLT